MLAARPHGETAAIVQLLTRERGRHAGLVQGGQGRKAQPVLQPGNLVSAAWSGRLTDQLGRFQLELARAYAARYLSDTGRLLALASAMAVTEISLPERQAYPAIYDGLVALLDLLGGEHWAELYVQWELLLLAALGFGLDLTRCAAGGDNDQLAYVSPRSGRAVSLAAGEAYRDRLLPLPDFLAGRGGGGNEQVSQGLRLTGYFLEKHLLRPADRVLPVPRARLQSHFPAAAG